MARPTKEEQKKREILSKYFRRDNDIYLKFEDIIKDISNNMAIYEFIQLCSFRKTCITIGGICATFNDNGSFDFNEEEIIYKELKNISTSTHDYYSSILAYSKSLYKKKKYKAYQMIDEVILLELFGEKRVKEFDNRGYPHYIPLLLRQLTDNEKIILKKHIKNSPFGHRSIIRREYANKNRIFNYDDNFLVEIDFNKPFNEINEYIKNLHEEYQKNNIKNVFDILNIKKDTQNCIEHPIYSTNSHKPFNIILADKLFTYDAFKHGLNISDIKNSIDNYSNKVLRLSNDKIHSKTISEYLKTTINLIDNKGFLDFL